MRLSDLIGRDVVTGDGEVLGQVHEALLVQDGPVISESAAAFRVHALAVGRRALGAQLGYFQGNVTGPALLRRLLRWEPTLVPWSAIRSLDDDRVVVEASQITQSSPGDPRRSR
jgi:sporulation protein YlmC with PRC-barrel domain